jgi:hypothetical protein
MPPPLIRLSGQGQVNWQRLRRGGTFRARRWRCPVRSGGRKARHRGRKWVDGTEILVPGRAPGGQSRAKSAAMRKRFRRRAAIEPLLSHLKHDFRLLRCFLKGFRGDQLNLMLAAAAWNFRKWMRLVILFWLRFFRSFSTQNLCLPLQRLT